MYTNWDEDETDCEDKVAKFYDPTVTCAYGSVNIDKGLCSDEDEESTICWDPDALYDCDWDDSDWMSNCAPGDLSSRYGEIDISSSRVEEISGTDDFMPLALNSLYGLSVVLQCADTYEIIACAEWTDCEDCTNLNASSSSDSGGDAKTWIIIILILVAIGAVYYYYKQQKQKNAGGADANGPNGATNGNPQQVTNRHTPAPSQSHSNGMFVFVFVCIWFFSFLCFFFAVGCFVCVYTYFVFVVFCFDLI